MRRAVPSPIGDGFVAAGSLVRPGWRSTATTEPTGAADPRGGATIVSGRAVALDPAGASRRGIGVTPLQDRCHAHIESLEDLRLGREDVEAVLPDALEDLVRHHLGRVPRLQCGREAGAELLQLLAQCAEVGAAAAVVGAVALGVEDA